MRVHLTSPSGNAGSGLEAALLGPVQGPIGLTVPVGLYRALLALLGPWAHIDPLTGLETR